MNRISGARVKAAAGVHAKKQLRALGITFRNGAGVAAFKGKQAYATWNMYPESDAVSDFAINYPAMPDNALVSRREADLISAYTLHELGHIAFTDNSAVKGIQRLKFHLWNGIEDARIEHAVIASGNAAGARSAFKRLMSKFTVGVDEQGFNPTKINAAPFALALICRAALGDGNGYAKTLLNRVPEPKRALYAAVADAMPGLPLGRSGSAAALALADAFLEGWLAIEPDALDKPTAPIMSQAADDEQQQSDEQQQDSDEDSDDQFGGDAADESESDADDSTGSFGFGDPFDDDNSEDSDEQLFGESGDADDDSDDAADADAIADALANAEEVDDPNDGSLLDSVDEDDGDEDDGLGGSLDGESEFPDLSEPYDEDEVLGAEPNIDDLFEAISKRTNKPVDLPPTTIGKRTQIRNWQNVEFSDIANTRAARKYTREAALPALKAQLYRILRAPERCGWDGGALGGRFDGKRSARMLSGSEAVFKQRWFSEGINTAISVVVDMSSSMKGDRIKQSVDLAWTVAQAAETAGCDVEVVGFTTSYGGRGYAATHGFALDAKWTANGNNVNSSEGATLVVAKRWQDKVANCAQYFNIMKRAVSGATPDYSAIRTVAEQLSNHKAQRKLVIVITDGCGEMHSVKTLTERSFDLYGVDVIGFGIGIRQERFSDIYAVGSSVGWGLADLHKTCLKSVADQLAKRDMRRVA